MSFVPGRFQYLSAGLLGGVSLSGLVYSQSVWRSVFSIGWLLFAGWLASRPPKSRFVSIKDVPKGGWWFKEDEP